MSDVKQTESGADQNALRNNIPVGEYREYEVAAVHQISADVFVVAAWVEDDDVDADSCQLAPGLTGSWSPSKGDVVRFTRLEGGDLQISMGNVA